MKDVDGKALPPGMRVVYPVPYSADAEDARAEYIEDGGEVMRCHTFPTLRPQTVAAHSFGVAWWCAELMDGNPRADLLMAALAHDLPESRFGDIPAPAKRKLTAETREALYTAELDSMAEVGLPDYDARLTRAEGLVLKLADYLELLAYTVRELELGNRHRTLLRCVVNASQYVRDVLVTYNEEGWHGITYMIGRRHFERLTNKARSLTQHERE